MLRNEGGDKPDPEASHDATARSGVAGTVAVRLRFP